MIRRTQAQAHGSAQKETAESNHVALGSSDISRSQDVVQHKGTWECNQCWDQVSVYVDSLIVNVGEACN
jgi:hypothetical protein